MQLGKHQQTFVILSLARSGSYMLVSALNKHPDIACFGELLRHNAPTAVDGFEILEVLPERFRDLKYRQDHPLEFIEAAFRQRPSAKAIGLKLMLMQNPMALECLIRDSGIKKILLWRDNQLAAYSSMLIARETGQGLAAGSDKIKNVRIKFDEQDFTHFYKGRNRAIEHTRTLLENSLVEFLDIEYLEAASKEGLQRAVGFIGVDPHINLASDTKKRNSSNIITRFKNPRKVYAFLKRIDKIEWANENDN